MLEEELFCRICGLDLVSFNLNGGDIRVHMETHRQEGYCLICSSKDCRCLSPFEAMQKFPLKSRPCASCVHFWQECYGGKSHSKLYIDKRGRLIMVQGCGLVEDYDILARSQNCDLYEDLHSYPDSFIDVQSYRKFQQTL